MQIEPGYVYDDEDGNRVLVIAQLGERYHAINLSLGISYCWYKEDGAADCKMPALVKLSANQKPCYVEK